MRARTWAVVVALLLLALAFGLVRYVDALPKGRGKVPVLPTTTAVSDADAPIARRASDPDQAVVQCDVRGAPAGHLVATPMGLDVEDEAIRSAGHGDLAVLTLDPGAWFLRWAYEAARSEDGEAYYGYFAIGPVELSAGEVRVCRFNGEGFPVEGRVVDPAGDPVEGADLQGCGLRGPTAADGTFSGEVSLFWMDTATGTCDVRAQWVDGLLRRSGEGVTLSLFEVPTELTLVIDTSPIAGLGIGFRPLWNGVAVTWVREASPAERAGLEQGDLIVELDGRSTAALTEDAFVRMATGVEGTTAKLLVLTPDEEEVIVRIRRERIDEDQ